MIEYNEIMLAAILGLSSTVWGVMEFPVKPFFSRVFESLSKWKRLPNVVISKEAKYAAWRVIGVLLGIGAVVLVDDVSFLKLWNIATPDKYEWVDVVVTGIIVGLGDRGIHWVVDGIEANGANIARWLKLLAGVNS